MSEVLRPTRRTLSVDKAIPSDLDGVSLRNHQFQRLVAVKKRFVNCDFSYSHFDSAYLRHCTFDSCIFVGCKFLDSNHRNTQITGCKFDYVEFIRTHVEPEILDTGLPGMENLQQKFARSLRINFQQTGDTKAANKAIRAELTASQIHLLKAWKSHESYYRDKYCGGKRFQAFVEWAAFWFLDFYWGNGESVWKLFRFLILVIVVITIGDTLVLGDPLNLRSYFAAVSRACQVFLGVEKISGFNGLVLSLIALLRYIMLACLVSIIVKRFNRR